MLKLIFKRSATRGFTLIEIMVVVVILGLLATVIGTRVFSALDEAKVQTARTQIKGFEGALAQYRLKCGSYPGVDQGLTALVEKPSSGKACKRYPKEGFLQGKVPQDPWGGEYQYANPGTNNPNGVDIWTYGPDSEAGTEDDIGNWAEKASTEEK